MSSGTLNPTNKRTVTQGSPFLPRQLNMRQQCVVRAVPSGACIKLALVGHN